MANMFRADFHGWRAVSGLSKVTIRQKFGNHTLFFLDYNISTNQRYLLPPENTPFTVWFGIGPLGVRTAYGYVNHLEDRVAGDGHRYTRLVGIGTSKVLNTSIPTSWNGLSRTGIVREIAARHRLRSVIHSHESVLDTWSSGSLTDFRAVNNLADEVGYRLWVDGATLWLLDPHLVLASASPVSTKLVSFRQQRDTQVFKGSNVPGQVRASKRTVQYGVNATSNEVLVSTGGDPNLPVEMLVDPVTTYSDAQLTAIANQTAMQDQSVISATIDGDATLTPGAPIRFNSNAKTFDQAGLWLINETTHEIGAEGFTTSLSASRDKDRLMLSRVPDVVRREGNVSRAVIRNGRTWEAEIQERIHV
jgi:hypothetical protein